MERWDVYDREGRLTGRTRGREDPFGPGEYHLGVALWVVNGAGEYLVQRRAATKRIHPGKWGITGGAAQAGETSRQACVREVWEELDLDVREDELIPLARTAEADNLFDDYVLQRDFSLETARLQPDEVSEVRWATLAQILAWLDQDQFMWSNRTLLVEMDAHIRAALGLGEPVSHDEAGREGQHGTLGCV